MKTLADKLEETVAALRKLAIIPSMKPRIRQVVQDGYRCRLCASTWKLGSPEQHANTCVLKGTEQ